MHFRDNTSQYNVLIVDDDPVILNLLTHLLEMGHYRVRSASDGNQALQMVLQDCPDILIADWFMPGLDGLELCRRVRQLHTRKVLPHYSYILVLTMHSSRNSIIEALEAGADDFVQKDVTSLSDFRAEIQARLNAAQRIRRLEIDLEFAARYDSLTRLHNRIAFFEIAQTLWERSIRSKSPLAAVMMDCDLFKRINDIHGHVAGDAVLKELAATLRSFSRSSDVICRYGGEEFCAILPGCNEEIAWDWADRIRQQCESIPIKYGDLNISITASFGVAERTDSTELLDHLIDRADQALLAAKEWGRNKCVSYSEVLADASGKMGYFTHRLLDDIMAGEVMAPFPLSIQLHDLVAIVADHFLQTRFEMLPVTDHEGKLIGTISETDIIAMVGHVEQWVSPIKQFVNPNVVSYPVDAPVRKIVDFLNRTSVRRVMIVQDGVLVGHVCRTPLLRWLRNQWAAVSGQHGDIIPNVPSYEILAGNLRSAIDGLKKELANFDAVITDDDMKEIAVQDRRRMISMISQCQDVMDQVLKYGSIPTVHDSDILLRK
jgi:diguanylate cyclase (GGDEF)-like protein